MSLIKVDYGEVSGGGEVECVYMLRPNGISYSAGNYASLQVAFMYYDGNTYKTLVNAVRDSYISNGGVVFTEADNLFYASYSAQDAYVRVVANEDVEYSTDLTTWTTLAAGETYVLGTYSQTSNTVYVRKMISVV